VTDLRDRIADAIAEWHHDWDKATFLEAADAVIAVLPDTCDASANALGGEPVGPCILRHGHDGPVHQDATGAKWWPRTDPRLHLDA
jgi:hypothetical protein